MTPSATQERRSSVAKAGCGNQLGLLPGSLSCHTKLHGSHPDVTAARRSHEVEGEIRNLAWHAAWHAEASTTSTTRSSIASKRFHRLTRERIIDC